MGGLSHVPLSRSGELSGTPPPLLPSRARTLDLQAVGACVGATSPGQSRHGRWAISGTATSIAVIVVIVVGLPLLGMAVGWRLRSMPPLVREDHSPRSLHTRPDPGHLAVELTADGRDGKCAGSGERTGGRKIL